MAVFSPRRALGVALSTALSAWAVPAMAQGAPGAAATPAVTYTPMRRPGAVSAPAAVPPAAVVPRAPAPATSPAAPSAPTTQPAAALPAPAPPPTSPLMAPGGTAYSPYLTAPPAPHGFYAPQVSPLLSPSVGRAWPEAGPTTVATVAKPVRHPVRRALGLGLDVGAPDGVNLSLVVAPLAWLRLNAAFGTNTASLGYRGGVAFVPVGFGPSFSFEAGHCNRAETNVLLRTMFSAPGWAAPYVQKLGYTYFNAHVGYDYVRGNFTVFLHGGYTYLVGTVGGSQPVVVDSKSSTTAKVGENGQFSAHTLSAKLGILYMFGGA